MAPPETPVVTKDCLASPSYIEDPGTRCSSLRVPVNVLKMAVDVRKRLVHQKRVKERLRHVAAALGWHVSYTHRQK